MEEYSVIMKKVLEKNGCSDCKVLVEKGKAKIVDLKMVDTEIKIDNAKVLKKWKPILDALNINKSSGELKNIKRTKLIDDILGEKESINLEDMYSKFALFNAVYAEFHQQHNNSEVPYGVPTSYGVTNTEMPYSTPSMVSIPYVYNIHREEYAQNLLPVSMKIISRLDILDKQYEIKTGLPTIETSLMIDGWQYYRELGMDPIAKFESYLIDLFINELRLH